MKTFILLACIAVTACNATKSTASDAKDASDEITDTRTMETTSKTTAEMEAEGYMKGTIEAGKGEGSCAYTIYIKDSSGEQRVDPTNLSDSFKADAQKVWVKFRGLRMMNRCPEARPVEVTEIFARAE